jgi:isopentenyl phosphate kinase
MICALKLGGSVITDKSKPFTPREDVISRIAEEVKDALKGDKDLKLIVGNGGGSFPHQPAEKGRLVEGIKEPWQVDYLVKTQKAASDLNSILLGEFVEKGLPAFSVKPSSAGYTTNGEIVSFNTKSLDMLLSLGAIPLVYGDVFLDVTKGCSIVSTERLFKYLSGTMEINRMIIGTNVDGVLDQYGKAIPEVNRKVFSQIKGYLGGSEDTDVTGGMRHKVEMLLEIALHVPEVRIINALEKGNVKKALEGYPLGTKITYYG